MKQQLLQDLHLLYSVPLHDCFDTTEALMRLLMARHALCFRPRQQVAASIHWRDGADVASKFFDEICPGPVLGLARFSALCEEYMDFDHWQPGMHREQLTAAPVLTGMPRADHSSPHGLELAA